MKIFCICEVYIIKVLPVREMYMHFMCLKNNLGSYMFVTIVSTN